MIGDAIGPLDEFGEAHLHLAAALVDKPQCRLPVAARERVEMVERPIEALEFRPAELAIGGVVILAIPQQEVTGGTEGRGIGGGHGRSSPGRGSRPYGRSYAGTGRSPAPVQAASPVIWRLQGRKTPLLPLSA